MTRIFTKTLSAATASFFALSLPAAAAGILYECDMSNINRGNGWVSPKIAFVLPGDGSVTVVDAVTLHFNGKPLGGKIQRDSNTHTHIRWTIKDARSDNGTAFSKVDYKAVLTKASGRINLTTKARQSASNVQTQGRCAKRTK